MKEFTREEVTQLWKNIQALNLSVGLEQETLDDCRKACSKEFDNTVNRESKGNWVRNSMDVLTCTVCGTNDIFNAQYKCKCDEEDSE